MLQRSMRLNNPISELNDARILATAERLLAWNKLSVTCVVLGLFVERLGWLLRQEPIGARDTGTACSLAGIATIGIGVLLATWSYLQHERVIKAVRLSGLRYHSVVKSGHMINVLVGFLGSTLGLVLYFDVISGL